MAERPLAHLYDSVASCNKCGYCLPFCPTYVATGKETISPRGRVQLVRAIIEGSLSDPMVVEESLSTCLLCKACTAVCFSQVPTADFVVEAKRLLGERKSLPFTDRFLFRWILPHPFLFSLVVWAAALAKRAGLAWLLRPFLSKRLRLANDLVPKPPLVFLRSRARKISKPKFETASSYKNNVAFFASCGMNYLFPEASLKSLSLLEKAGKPVRFWNHVCCGLPPHSAGDLESSKRLARGNLKLFEKTQPSHIVTDDSSCSGYLKEYGRIFPEDSRAKEFSFRVKDLSEFLEEAEFSGGNLTGARLTYHDPCQIGNGFGLFSSPRNLLRKAGAEILEMEGSAECCGGAGTYCLNHPRLSDEILERKLDFIKKTKAEVVVTSATSCLLHIGHGIRRGGLKVRLAHLSEVLCS